MHRPLCLWLGLNQFEYSALSLPCKSRRGMSRMEEGEREWHKIKNTLQILNKKGYGKDVDTKDKTENENKRRSRRNRRRIE